MSSRDSPQSSSPTEPPKKRIKADSTDKYPYRPEMVLLGVALSGIGSQRPKHDTSSVYACVHSAQFNRIAIRRYRWDEAAVRKDGSTSIRHIELKSTEYFIEFIAHYAQERNATAAIDCIIPDEGVRSERFFMIYKDACEQKGFVDEIQDSLTECLLDWFKKKMRDGRSVDDTLRSIIQEATQVESDMSWYIYVDSLRESHLIKLLTILVLHHAKDRLKCRSLYDRFDESDRFPSTVRDCPAADLLELFPQGDTTTIPKDPLAEGFDDHCLYHVHGKDEACYRSKSG